MARNENLKSRVFYAVCLNLEPATFLWCVLKQKVRIKTKQHNDLRSVKIEKDEDNIHRQSRLYLRYHTISGS